MLGQSDLREPQAGTYLLDLKRVVIAWQRFSAHSSGRLWMGRWSTYITCGSSVFAVGTPRCCGCRHGCYRVSA